jgi:hypothetical protein
MKISNQSNLCFFFEELEMQTFVNESRLIIMLNSRSNSRTLASLSIEQKKVERLEIRLIFEDVLSFEQL